MTQKEHRSVAPSIQSRIDGEQCPTGNIVSNIRATVELPIKIVSEGKNFCRMGLVLQAVMTSFRASLVTMSMPEPAGSGHE